MDESRWYNSAEAYRAVQALVREGRFQEAVERAGRVLQEGTLGRKQAARLHSQICWLYVEQMHKPCPAALLHGEEAIRLANLVGDQWIRSEALARLVHAYCRMGDLPRARQACRDLARELEQNDLALAGGQAALLQLEATVYAAEGDAENCLAALDLAEEMAKEQAQPIRSRIYLQKALALLECGRHAEAAHLLENEGPAAQATSDILLEWELARTWAAVVTRAPAAEALIAALRAKGTDNPVIAAHALALQAVHAQARDAGEAARLARIAEARALQTGRVDLARSLQRRLRHLALPC